MSVSTAQYDFGYGERHEYSIITAQNIARYAEEKPGIYSWHYRLSHIAPDRSADMKAYDRIYAAKSYDVSARGSLSETLNGTLTRSPFTNSTPPEFSQAALTAAAVFCPPLYIGISTKIKRRLQTHYDRLVEVLAQSSSFAPTSSIQTDDSDEESGVFAERIGKLLKENNIGDPGRLFVKVVYVPNATFRELQQAEFFVNRTFVPLCGRL